MAPVQDKGVGSKDGSSVAGEQPPLRGSQIGPIDGKVVASVNRAVLSDAVLRTPEFFVTVFRRDDMVALNFGFINMVLDETGANLVPRRTFVGTGAPAAPLIVVSHGPQHVLERAYIEDEAKKDLPPASGPIPTRLAGASRVAYLVPERVSSIPFTVEDLLAIARDYEVVVGLNATPPDPPSHRIVSVGGMAFAPLLDSTFLAATSDVVRPSPAVTAAPTLGQLVRSTRGLRAVAQTGAVDVGFSPGPIASEIPPFEFLPTVPVKPAPSETMLELPFRLEVSPNTHAQWAHATSPIQGSDTWAHVLRPAKGSDTRVELWHSRLATRGDDGQPFEGSSYLNTIRALWTRDSQMAAKPPKTFDDTLDSDPFKASLRPKDRIRIVHQSSNFTLTDKYAKLIKPLPVTVNRLMLTALGGWMDVRGDWGYEPKFDLAQWEHRATMGRDHFVKIVETGYLYPFGHRAVLITISERKFKTEHPHVAFVRKRMFLVVKQPVVDYTAGRDLPDAQSHLRKLPFVNIHIKTLMSPNLDGLPDPTDPPEPVSSEVFPALVNTVPFRFACEALDPEGRLVQFTAPVVWVEGNPNDTAYPGRVPHGPRCFRGLCGGRPQVRLPWAAGRLCPVEQAR
jgi:hypothetical protein